MKKSFFQPANMNKLTATNNPGFSLVETILVVAISTFVFLAMVSAINFFYRTNDYSVQQAAAITSARRGVENMVRDIREASYSNNGAYPVFEMSTSSFTFFSDIDRDETVEQVRYFLDDTDFKLTTTKPSGDPPSYTTGTENTQIISDNVRNNTQNEPIFRYFNAAGQEMTDLEKREEVAFVRVEVIVNVDPNRKPENLTLRSSATMRNVHKPS